MRTTVIVIALISTLPNIGVSQQWGSLVSIDTRVGYTSNTYLNPFVANWDPTVEEGYGLTSLIGQAFWNKDKNALSFTGGLVYEPFFGDNSNWKGGLGLLNANHRFSGKFSAGVDAGFSHFSSSFRRTQAWIQPSVTWFPSSFTLVRAKAGSIFRTFRNFADSLDTSDRFDLYALELETWPGYRWQLTAGLYGQLETIPSVQEGFNSRVAARHYFKNGSSVSFTFGIEQYQFETTVSGGGPGPPIGGGGAPVTERITDRILRLGLEGSLPINDRFSVFAGAEGLQYSPGSAAESSTDYHLSAGLRFTIEPRLNRKTGTVEPRWERGDGRHTLRIRYAGEGRLYLTGTFNGWQKPGIPLREQSDNVFAASVSLDPGMHEYRILRVRGNVEEWLEFSEDTYTVDDGYNGENAVIMIEIN